ncbi:MAG: hypothetical protein ACAI43_26955 [Phycisphaerae bacterium]
MKSLHNRVPDAPSETPATRVRASDLPGAGVGTGGVRPEIDTRLVAAVQAAAGARCHEAAGLLQSYLLWARIYRTAQDTRAPDEAEVGETFRQTKVRLRAFLTDGLLGCGLAAALC